MKIWILALLSLMPLTTHAAQRPNIVFLLVDDLRWNALGCMGDAIVKTPNIDALATDGVLFAHAFVTTSICSVSRASILTGQWERRHGIVDFATGLTAEQWKQTYPAMMRADGFRTGFVGKYGVGTPQETAAKGKEFDYWRGEPGQGTKLFIQPDDPTRTHATARYGNEAIEFIQSASADEPFCLSVSFSAVHARDRQPREYEPDPRDETLYADVEIPLPLLASQEAFEKVPDFVKTSEGRRRWEWRFDEKEKAQNILRDYYRLITGVDREVGRIRDILKERGVADNTIIIVTSDNGYALGDRGLADKWFMWEEDIRVATVIFDPRLPDARRGKKVDAMALNVDLAPTMLELAGITPPAGMQGRSLKPILEGGAPDGWRTEFFYEHHSVPNRIPQVEGVRTERWKYIRWIVSEPLVEELYDLQSDPLEQNNVVNDPDHAAQLQALRVKWQEYAKSLQ